MKAWVRCQKPVSCVRSVKTWRPIGGCNKLEVQTSHQQYSINVPSVDTAGDLTVKLKFLTVLLFFMIKPEVVELAQLTLGKIAEAGVQFEIDLQAKEEEINPVLSKVRSLGIDAREKIGSYNGYEHKDNSLFLYTPLNLIQVATLLDSGLKKRVKRIRGYKENRKIKYGDKNRIHGVLDLVHTGGKPFSDRIAYNASLIDYIASLFGQTKQDLEIIKKQLKVIGRRHRTYS